LLILRQNTRTCAAGTGLLHRENNKVKLTP